MNIYKTFCLSLFLLTTTSAGWAQSLSRTDQKFHQASEMYINKDYENALATVKDGLKSDPRSEKLESLRKLLEQEQKKQQQQQEQDKKDQQKKDQEKKEQQQKDEQKKQDEEGEKSDQKDSEQKPEEQKDEGKEGEEKEQDQNKDNKEQNPENQKADPSKKLEEMKMSEEKARMILEAMKNQEMQYLQQQRRKATQPRDRNKPDW